MEVETTGGVTGQDDGTNIESSPPTEPAVVDIVDPSGGKNVRRGVQKEGEFEEDESDYKSGANSDSSTESIDTADRTESVKKIKGRDDDSISQGENDEDDEDKLDDNNHGEDINQEDDVCRENTIDAGDLSYGDFEDDARVSIRVCCMLLLPVAFFF